jgi:hypothetical protein
VAGCTKLPTSRFVSRESGQVLELFRNFELEGFIQTRLSAAPKWVERRENHDVYSSQAGCHRPNHTKNDPALAPTPTTTTTAMSTIRSIAPSKFCRSVAASRSLITPRLLHTTLIAARASHGKAPLEEHVPGKDTNVSPILGEGNPKAKRPDYVVAEAPASEAKYDVPPGAFPSSSPYQNYQNTTPPDTLGKLTSSTAPAPAHPNLSKRVPRNESGVGESAAVRHTEAPGELGARGGGNYGAGLMDEKTTRPGEDGELPDVNEAPIFNAEHKSKLGNRDAWKERR